MTLNKNYNRASNKTKKNKQNTVLLF